jgi:cyanophycinase
MNSHCKRGALLSGFLFTLFAAIAAPGAEPAPADSWFDPDGIRGSLLLCGGGRLPESVRDEFVKRAGGANARLVIIPTANYDENSIEADTGAVAEIWRSRGIENISVVHADSNRRLLAESRKRADDPEFVKPISQATAVWFSGGWQHLVGNVYSGTLVEKELRALLDRGGVVGGTSAGAACLARVMTVRTRIEQNGLGLMPGAIVDQHFLVRNRKPRLQEALEKFPELVGLGIDEQTALVVEGRSMRCIGESSVTICFGKTSFCECDDRILKPNETTDLTMLRRAAQARLQTAFPPVEPPAPVVSHGSLVIVGGGPIPAEVATRFIDLAGGPDSFIVVLPTAAADPLPAHPTDGEFLVKAGARNIRLLTARSRADVESDEYLATLKQARGIWFGGGRQWRFVDAYEGTNALDAFRDVLQRGGVIGGSSAGATIQGDYLVRGSPLGNEQMMCPGYERGFAFLPGVAIDQHFTKRNRFADMTSLMAAHPQLLGIGIDESTALVVQNSTAEVLGEGKLHIYDRRKPIAEGRPDYETIGAGGRYELAARKLITDGELLVPAR